MSKVQKLRRAIREMFPDQLDHEFRKEFNREIDTAYNLIHGYLVSTPKDGKKLTKEQARWIAAWSAGYRASMDQVTEGI